MTFLEWSIKNVNYKINIDISKNVEFMRHSQEMGICPIFMGKSLSLVQFAIKNSISHEIWDNPLRKVHSLA